MTLKETVMRERVFVVGAGATTCVGKDLESTWQSLIAGRSGIRRHSALDGESFLQDIAGMVDGLEGDTIWADRTVSKLGARFLPLALRAACDAWADAGLNTTASPPDPHRVAVVVGSAFGGVDFLEA